MSHIVKLRDAIEELHGAKAEYVQSVSVREEFKGKVVWDGIVEVFNLVGHPKTNKAYAWMHDNGKETFPVTVLHIHPALTPIDAVRAFILQELRNASNEA